MDDTEKEFYEPTAHNLIGILHLIGKVCYAFNKGYLKRRWNESQLKNLLENFIDRTFSVRAFKSHAFRTYSLEKQKMSIKRFFSRISDEISFKKAIQEKIFNKLEETYKEKTLCQYKIIIEKIKEKPKSFEVWYKGYNKIEDDCFSYQEPEDIWNVLKGLSTRDFVEIVYFLQEHIDYHLKTSEISFWKEFINLANKDLIDWKSENRNIWKGDCIEIFCKEVNEKLVEYETKAKLQLKKEDDQKSEGTN